MSDGQNFLEHVKSLIESDVLNRESIQSHFGGKIKFVKKDLGRTGFSFTARQKRGAWSQLALNYLKTANPSRHEVRLSIRLNDKTASIADSDLVFGRAKYARPSDLNDSGLDLRYQIGNRLLGIHISKHSEVESLRISEGPFTDTVISGLSG